MQQRFTDWINSARPEMVPKGTDSYRAAAFIGRVQLAALAHAVRKFAGEPFDYTIDFRFKKSWEDWPLGCCGIRITYRSKHKSTPEVYVVGVLAFAFVIENGKETTYAVQLVFSMADKIVRIVPMVTRIQRTPAGGILWYDGGGRKAGAELGRDL